jgi:hypothetical protein
MSKRYSYKLMFDWVWLQILVCIDIIKNNNVKEHNYGYINSFLDGMEFFSIYCH